MEQIEVKVGQVWQDNDPRNRNLDGSPQRVYKVIELLPHAARMKSIHSDLYTGVRLDRMRGLATDGRKTGWSLVREAE